MLRRASVPLHPKFTRLNEETLEISRCVFLAVRVDQNVPCALVGQPASLLECRNAMMADIGNPRFVPYIQVHEYEAMLFVAPEVTDGVLKVISGRSQLSELQTVLQGYESPEHINGGIETAPSKRIESFYPGYRKPLHGVIVASRVGLDQVLGCCQHFKDWLERLSALPASA